MRLITTDPSFYVQQQALSVYDPARRVAGHARCSSIASRMAARQACVSRRPQRLLRKPDAAGLDALESMTAEKETRTTRTTALNILARWPDKSRAVAVATKYLNDGDPLFAVAAVQALGRVGGAAGKATLERDASTESRVTVKAAIARVVGGVEVVSRAYPPPAWTNAARPC